MSALTTFNPSAAFESEVADLLHAYDDLRDALFEQNRQKIASALSPAKRIAVDELRLQLDAAGAPASHNEIVAAVAQLMSVTKMTGGLNVDVYLKTLIEDIEREAPTRIVLLMAMRKVRHTTDFIPSIRQVMVALEETAANFRSASYRLKSLPERIMEAEAFLSPDRMPARLEERT